MSQFRLFGSIAVAVGGAILAFTRKSRPLLSTTSLKCLQKPVVALASAKTLRLRLHLVSQPIDLSAAMLKLNIQNNSQAHYIFQNLLTLSKDIRYIYDAVYEQEFIIVLHPYRDYIAVYQTTPLYYDPSLAYSVVRSSQFFKDNNLDHVLEREYRRLVAVRCIQRHPNFRNWLERPITNDGTLGIECRLALKASRSHLASTTSDPMKLALL